MTGRLAYLKSGLDDQLKRRVSRILMKPYERTLIEMPVHLCPDDGDETEMRWVNDVTPVVEAIMEIIEQVYATGYEAGKWDGA